jgi:CheY-like chemotaxis protein
MIAAALVEARHVVAAAKNGRERLERCREYGADLVVLDLVMPELDGFQFLKLRPTEGCDAPVIAMSAASIGTGCRRTRRWSAFIEKPLRSRPSSTPIAAHAPNGEAARRRRDRRY